MGIEGSGVPSWELAPIIEPYKGIRVDGTEIKAYYGFKDYWGRLYCRPWYSIEAAQAAADRQKQIDDAPV